MNKIIQLSIFIIAIVFLAQCKSENKTNTTEEQAVMVTTNTVNSNYDMAEISVSGKLVSKNTVNIGTRLMGYITSINAEVGQSVKQGQVLVKINSSDLQAKDGQAKAQVIQAQANYENAKKDYERFQDLYKNHSTSQKEYDDMCTRYEMAKAGLEGAQQMKNEINAQYNYTNITAPISGIVTASYSKQGDMATPGKPILTIETTSVLQANVLVSEDNIRDIKQGMPAKVRIKNIGEEIDGRVSEISYSSVSTGGQYLVKIDIKPSSKLLPGMYVNVNFLLKKSQAVQNSIITIPANAIIEQGQLSGVYTVSANNTAVLRWVKTGKKINNSIEILSGLSSNEKYIVSAEGKLYNGAKIQVK